MKKRLISILVCMVAGIAAAQSGPQIPLAGSIGVPGSSPTLCAAAVVMPSDANFTLTANQYACNDIYVTSSVPLTATRNVVAPLNYGQQFTVTNATTGGQAIQIIGATGAGATIPNGKNAIVGSTNGTAYEIIGSIGAVYQVSCTNSTGSHDLDAVRAGIVALSGSLNGALLLDPINPCYLDLSGASGTEALLITTPISIYGPGTLAFGNIPSTMVRVHYKPAATNPFPGTGGLGPAYYANANQWMNFTLVDATAPNTYTALYGVGLAQHSIWLDASDNDINALLMLNVRSLPVIATGHGVHVNNTTATGVAPFQTAVNSNGGIYDSQFIGDSTWGGYYMMNSGDRNTWIADSIFPINNGGVANTSDGIFIAQINGAATDSITNSNIQSTGAAVHFAGGTNLSIKDSELGLSKFFTNTTTCGTICIDASVSPVHGVNVEGGFIGADQIATQNLPLISISSGSSDVKIGGGVFLSSNSGIPAILNNGNSTCLDLENINMDLLINTPLLSGNGSICQQDQVSFSGEGSQIQNGIPWSNDFSNAAWTKTSSGLGVNPTVGTASVLSPRDGVATTVSQIYLNVAAGSTSADTSYINQIVSGRPNPHPSAAGLWVASNLFITGASSTGTTITYLLNDTSSVIPGDTFKVANINPSTCNTSGKVTAISTNVSITISSTNACTWVSGGNVVYTVDFRTSASGQFLEIGDNPTGTPLYGWTYFNNNNANVASTTTDLIGLELFAGLTSRTANIVVYHARVTTNANVPYIETKATAQSLTHGLPASQLVGLNSNVVSPALYAGTTTGAVNVMAACPIVPVTSLVAGLRISFIPNVANTTTTPTLNLCGLGAVNITKYGTSVVNGSDLKLNTIAYVTYDGTNFQLENPQATTGSSSIVLQSSPTLFSPIINTSFTFAGGAAFTSNLGSTGTALIHAVAAGATPGHGMVLDSNLNLVDSGAGPNGTCGSAGGVLVWSGSMVTCSSAIVVPVGGGITSPTFNPTAAQTTVSCSTSGSVIFSEPFIGPSFKKVVAYENACLGTAAYTYPVAMINTPQVLSQGLAATASPSSTAVTITGATSTGYVNLEGY